MQRSHLIDYSKQLKHTVKHQSDKLITEFVVNGSILLYTYFFAVDLNVLFNKTLVLMFMKRKNLSILTLWVNLSISSVHTGQGCF